MSPHDLVYVGHRLDMAKKAVSKTTNLSRDAYDADENLRLALIHLVQVIGEAGRRVSRDFSDSHPEIPWAEIIGLRGAGCSAPGAYAAYPCGQVVSRHSLLRASIGSRRGGG